MTSRARAWTPVASRDWREATNPARSAAAAATASDNLGRTPAKDVVTAAVNLVIVLDRLKSNWARATLVEPQAPEAAARAHPAQAPAMAIAASQAHAAHAAAAAAAAAAASPAPSRAAAALAAIGSDKSASATFLKHLDPSTASSLYV